MTAPFRTTSARKKPEYIVVFEALLGGLASFAVLTLILFLLIWVIRLIAIDEAHARANAIASKAAQAVTEGLHADPIVSDDPDHNQAKASIFHRLDDALRGQPNVLSVRRFAFEGDFPIEVIAPRQAVSHEAALLDHHIISRLLDGVQFATHIGDSWFTAPKLITAYAPVYAGNGTVHGAVAVDLEPVALQARLDILRIASMIACAASFFFSCLLALKSFLRKRVEQVSQHKLDKARQFELITIEALGELLYSLDIGTAMISWRGELGRVLGARHRTPPSTIDAWAEWIHPEDRSKFRQAHAALLNEGDKLSLEYRILIADETQPAKWVLDRGTLMENADGALILVGAITDISLRKTSDALLREFIDQTPTAQFIFDGDEILNTNPAALQMIEASSLAALTERPLWTLWPPLQADGSISAEAWSRHVVAAIEDGTQHFEWLFRRFDGETLAVDVFLKSAILESRQVILMACHDLTDSKRTQSMLEESEERFRDVTESVGEFVWEVDAAGRYIYASQRVADILGITPEQAIGHGPFEWLFIEDQEQTIERSKQISDAMIPFRDFVHRVRRSDGTSRWIRVSGVPRFGINGELMGYRGITLDITQQREYEDALLLQKEAAEAADRAKSSFLAMMSHEIRTPLNSVLGFTDILLESPLTTSQRESLETIHSSGDALLHLLNDILDFSKIESDRLEIELQPTHVRNCLKDSVELQRQGARSKGLDIETQIDESLPEWIVSDPIRLKQILLNLLSNAVKFTAAGYVKIIVKRRAADIPGGEEFLDIRIQDTGVGIRDQQIERLFKPFSQADSSTTRQFGGSGLGLVISRRLTQLMGGDLELESTSENGTTFVLWLPLKAEEPPVIDDTPTKVIWFPFPGPKVLVVDDNPINRRLTQRILAQFGARVETAQGGEECLQILSHGTFDAVLMDVQMPGIDGLETTRRLRDREKITGAQPTPVIALTAGAMRGDREQCLEAGMNEYLTKPIRREALAATLARIIPGKMGSPPKP